jgi:hypothetical protein
MQELGAELDEQAWAVGNARIKNLDTEVLGLQQQRVQPHALAGWRRDLASAEGGLARLSIARLGRLDALRRHQLATHQR